MIKKKLVFLVSGDGGTLKFVFHALRTMDLPIEIVGIIADRKTKLDDFAIQNEIYYKQVVYKRSEPKELQKQLLNLNPDLIITNIHKIIDNETLLSFPLKFINLHYSLLPSFAGCIGMETVSMAKEQNVGFIGGTCHEVSEILDGGKVIHQGIFAVDWNVDDNIIDTVFKVSCLTILGGICSKLGIKDGTTKKILLNEKEMCFSPMIPFSKDIFDNKFWQKLKD